MKKLLAVSIGALGFLAAPSSHAWTYTNQDVLLIFRESGFNTVEFDIGSVNQFTSLTPGSTINVPNWSIDLVTNTFGSDLSGVSVIVAATTSKTAPTPSAWLTASDPSLIVSDVTASSWQSKLWSVVDAIGTKPVLNTLSPALTNAYSIDPSGITRTASYDYIVTSGGLNAASISQFGGNAAFAVEGVAPSSFAFWQISPSSAIPKPAAKYIGTFTIDASGTLRFTAGPFVSATGPTILGIARSGDVSVVSFTTTSGGNYWLVHTSTLTAALSTWPTVSGPITGDGNTQTLSHTNAEVAGFYGVVRAP